MSDKEHAVSCLLSAEVAKEAIEMVRPAILAAMKSGFLKRSALYIVVMNPVTRPHEIEDERDAILYEEFIGDLPRDQWSGNYDDFARSKGIISWRTGLPTHLVREMRPYLLQANDDTSDTIFWGSVVLDGLTVAGSGVQSYGDEWASNLVAATCRMLCIAKMQTLAEEKKRSRIFEPWLDGGWGEGR